MQLSVSVSKFYRQWNAVETEGKTTEVEVRINSVIDHSIEIDFISYIFWFLVKTIYDIQWLNSLKWKEIRHCKIFQSNIF